MKVAVSGKGGSGKTTVSGTLARSFAANGYETVVANKVRDEQDRAAIESYCDDHDLEITAVIPFDDAIHHADRDGTAPVDYDPETPSVRTIRNLTDGLQ